MLFVNFKDKFSPIIWKLTLTRAQELRIDEFSRHDLRESQSTKNELTSQIEELQERVKNMNDSREFQDVESICSDNLSHVPSQPAIVPSLDGMLSRNQRLRPDTWNAATSLRQHRTSVNYDRTTTATANERQFQAATTESRPPCGRRQLWRKMHAWKPWWQESDDNDANHWAPNSGAEMQSRPVGVDEPETVPHTQQDCTSTAHVDSSQSSAEQPEADSTTNKMTTAARLWWTSVLKIKHRSRAVTSKCRHPTTMMFEVYAWQAVSGPNTPHCRIAVPRRGISDAQTTSTDSQKRDLHREQNSFEVTAPRHRRGPSHPELTF